MQNFKSVYFQNSSPDTGRGRTLTLAFGEKDNDLYESIGMLSSEELRRAIGCTDYETLEDKAKGEGIALSTYCMSLLRKGAIEEPAGYARRSTHDFKPLQATFRGGGNELLHSWFPYLEGFSPDFVRQVIREYCPKAKTILDPFAGCGTTPITAASSGIGSYFCELNPVMQFVTETKLLVLNATANHRHKIVDSLGQLGKSFKKKLRNAVVDWRLQESYAQAFGSSVFFDEDTLASITKARTVIDDFSCCDLLSSRVATVAVLSALIPSSNLIRRGDVRFRNATEKKNRQDFVETVCANLDAMVDDVNSLEISATMPRLVCDDARQLYRIPKFEIDAAITSPPYLNGTNYFRNTKVELWFLRCLSNSKQLRAYRDKAVTAGINDVTKTKKTKELYGELARVVRMLEETAYDGRIPKMVAGYFEDMSSVLAGIARHLSDGGIAAIDIGDSAYAGVHVPTDLLLGDIADANGLRMVDNVVLRERLSRGGQALKQVLLVFETRRPTNVAEPRAQLDNRKNEWSSFKNQLPHQKGLFAKRNWGHQLHSLCSYQGKIKPSIAHFLVRSFCSNGDRMLDPFGGVGTIPFEAAQQGVHSYSFDISPAAFNISYAKVCRPAKTEVAKCVEQLENFLQTNRVALAERKAAEQLSFNGKILEYFHPRTFEEVLLARRFFLQNPPKNASEAIVISCLLHILHGNRPYALSRRSHPITPFAPTGEFEYRALVPRLEEKLRRSVDVEYPEEFVDGQVFFQDATSWWPQEVDQLDAIITSPPFFASTRFYLANWMRLWFCGWEKADFNEKPRLFVDEKQKASMQVYIPIFRQARERLKSGGVFVLHLGKSYKCDMAEELRKLAAFWFQHSEVFSESVLHCESHGIRDKGTVTEHQYLVLR